VRTIIGERSSSARYLESTSKLFDVPPQVGRVVDARRHDDGVSGVERGLHAEVSVVVETAVSEAGLGPLLMNAGEI
jgi:hypothetical protein